LGLTVERADTRRDYGEPRTVVLGLAQDIPLTVVYTDRVAGSEVVRRIISARKSNRREREAYTKATSTS
jgi:uncharacterized DUF497 family protein